MARKVVSMGPGRASCLGVGAGLLALSCQTLLGIEELSTTPREDGIEVGGSTGSAGSSGAPVAVAGSGGASQPGDLDAPLSGETPGADVDALADAGLPIAEPAPDGGAPEPTTLVVSGRVIDFYRRPVPDVPVSIGGSSASTDSDGRFSISDVTAPYDVSLLLDFARDGLPARYGYVYQDLTRDDPTLQVYTALPQRASASLDLSFDVPSFGDDPARALIFGFASPDTEFADGALSNGTVSILGGLAWSGGLSTSGHAHALLVSRPAIFEGTPPATYEAHQATELEASDGLVTSVAFQLQPGALTAGTLTGSVSGDTLGERANLVALRFTDGTVLPLVDESGVGEEFAYLVPNLPDSSLTVAASQGFIAPFAIVWRDGVAAEGSHVALDLPSPVRLLAPQPDATITANTRFSWSPPSGGARTYLLHVELENPSVYQGLFVATARTEIELPRFAEGFPVPAGASADWSVETHGDLPDVDAMTGPDGFLDPFSIPPQAYPYGPRRGGGSYTESAQSALTMDGG